MDTNTGEPRGCCFCGFALSATGAPRSPPLHPCPRRPRRPARLSSPPHRRRPARPLTSCIIFLRCRAAMFPPHHLSTRVSDAGARLAGRTQRSAAPSGRHSLTPLECARHQFYSTMDHQAPIYLLLVSLLLQRFRRHRAGDKASATLTEQAAAAGCLEKNTVRPCDPPCSLCLSCPPLRPNADRPTTD